MNFEKTEMFKLDVEMKERKNSRRKILFVYCKIKQHFMFMLLKTK